MQQLIFSLIITAASSALLTLCSLKPLQMFQLSSYKARGYIAWFKRSRFDYQIRCFVLAFFSFAASIIFVLSFPASIAQYIGAAFYIGLSAYFIALQKKEKQKTPLKFTPRIIRQIIILAVLYAALSFVSVYFLIYTPQNPRQNYVSYALVAALPLTVPLVTILSHYIALPLEKLNGLRYKKRAKRALNSAKIIKIGITGSYGKTSAKNILCGFLQTKYKVLSSPESHNTPMGLCKLINKGVAGYDVLIAEMGARHKGDIKELCRLINPDYAIVTAVGPQHLETFKTIENIITAKLDLARSADFSVINNDEKLKEEVSKDGILSVKYADGSLIFAGENGEKASCQNIKITPDGTRFDLKLNGKTLPIITPLLGRHIPALIAECAILANKLGVPQEDIIVAAANLKPVPHRLQLIKTPAATIIDDAFNSNPQGAKNALEVLAAFDCIKVVITPGFIELGALQAEKNRELGQTAAASADYLISVKNPDIIQGALDAGMDKARVLSAGTLNDAMKVFSDLGLSMPVILFLNDLPDNY